MKKANNIRGILSEQSQMWQKRVSRVLPTQFQEEAMILRHAKKHLKQIELQITTPLSIALV